MNAINLHDLERYLRHIKMLTWFTLFIFQKGLENMIFSSAISFRLNGIKLERGQLCYSIHEIKNVYIYISGMLV